MSEIVDLGSGDESDSAGLRCHNRKPHCIPGHGLIAKKISVDVFAAPAFPGAIYYYGEDGNSKNYPVGKAHLKNLVMSQNTKINKTSHVITMP